MTQPTDDFRLLPISRGGEVDLPAPLLSGEAARTVEMTTAFYTESGFVPPWISYLCVRDGHVVGAGAFVGAPSDGAVEIAYATFPDWQRQGNAERTAAALVALARLHDPSVSVWAKTLPEPCASSAILERLGFRLTGSVIDHEIGEAWRWTLAP